MRITGGKAKSILLKTPSGTGTRPATDRLRGSIFSSLAQELPGTAILDIFAGTGAYALEALSRGAQEAYCVELSAEPIACIKMNFARVAKSAGLEAHSLHIEHTDALTWSPPKGSLFDIIFIDPPYKLWPIVSEKLLPRVASWVKPGTKIFMEHPGEFPPSLPENWTALRSFGRGKHAPVSLLCSCQTT